MSYDIRMNVLFLYQKTTWGKHTADNAQIWVTTK